MEVDGIVCTSCLLEIIDVVDVSSNSTTKEFCASFDCGNTLLGYSGQNCNGADLTSNSIDYFVYRSLPCDGGCNLCGELPDENVPVGIIPIEAAAISPSNSTQDDALNSTVEATFGAMLAKKTSVETTFLLASAVMAASLVGFGLVEAMAM